MELNKASLKFEAGTLLSSYISCANDVLRSHSEYITVGILFLFVLVADASAFAATESHCLKYEPAVVSLRGTLISRTFPGPPNYESIRKGDRPERVLLLLLDEPVCVDGDPGSELNQKTELGAVLIQVGPPDSGWKFVGRRVLITGTLMLRHTGHHRTAVLLNLKEVRADPDAAHK